MAKKMTKPRKKHGRKDEIVAFKLTKRQKDRYLAASDAAEMELSEWIRRVLDEAADGLLDGAT